MKILEKFMIYMAFLKPKSKKVSFKKGFSLIELILAIVVVSIVLVALPNIVIQTQKSNVVAMRQDLIYTAKTMMGRIISLPWDSAAYKQMCEADKAGKGGGECSKSEIKRFSRDHSVPFYNAIELNGTTDRPGSLIIDGDYKEGSRISQNARSKHYKATPSAEFKSVSYGYNEENDIDDFNERSIQSSIVGKGDFTTTMSIDTRVYYVKDLSEANITNEITNIKLIKVEVKDTNETSNSEDHKTAMYFYAPNIGSTRPTTIQYKASN